ncbi:hypothetical protein LP420_20910 [Massilia sp. B-10]|nr:hypothetical protein LP420_20910 [Massilia sp. B-10]
MNDSQLIRDSRHRNELLILESALDTLATMTGIILHGKGVGTQKSLE